MFNYLILVDFLLVIRRRANAGVTRKKFSTLLVLQLTMILVPVETIQEERIALAASKVIFSA